jgi:hypothetical protein
MELAAAVRIREYSPLSIKGPPLRPERNTIGKILGVFLSPNRGRREGVCATL